MKKISLLFLIFYALNIFGNNDNCDNGAKILKINNGYKIISKNTPYKIKWFRNGNLIKTNNNYYNYKWDTIYINPIVSNNDTFIDSTFYISSWNPTFKIYDSFVYFSSFINYKSKDLSSIKKRNIYINELSHNICFRDFSYNNTLSLDNVEKKGDQIFYLHLNSDNKHVLLQKFKDTLRPYNYYNDTVLFDNLVYGMNFYTGVFDQERRQILLCRLNYYSLSDSMVYIDKLDYKHNIISNLLKINHKEFCDSTISNCKYKSSSNLYIFNNKLYFNYPSNELFEYDLNISTLKNYTIDNFNNIWSNLYITPYNELFYYSGDYNYKTIKKVNLSNDKVDTIAKVYSNYRLVFDLDCSGNIHQLNNIYNSYNILRTKIEDSLVSEESISAIVYFWNGDSIQLYYPKPLLTIKCTKEISNAYYKAGNNKVKLVFSSSNNIELDSSLNDTLKYSFQTSGKYYLKTIIFYNNFIDTFIDSFFINSGTSLRNTYSYCNLNQKISAKPYKNSTFINWKEINNFNKEIPINYHKVLTAQYIDSNRCNFNDTIYLYYTPYDSFIKLYGCDSLIWKNVPFYLSKTLEFIDTNTLGCNINYKVTLNVSKSKFDTFSVNSCLPYYWNNNLYKYSGLYSQTFKSSNQCDSTVTLNLKVGLDDKVILSNGTHFKSLQDSATYQWYLCNPWKLIANEKKQTFETYTQASYCVVISKDGCIDTSSCIDLHSMSISSTIQKDIQIYPNPFSKSLHIVLPSIQKNVMVSIIDLTGRVITESSFEQVKDFIITTNHIPQGVYELIITSNSISKVIFKIIKE